ncbi:60S ribosomal uL18 domain-containing protein [Aspergillus aculeatinus CBS 121060]|uniref:60S ribosomal protein L5 n=1 Tax=Aspergillus aculeatinus CBS 121060 TaxID=1448322 RepID=A0ACD1GRW1_9EURO|nr:60S ribosomal protein L5 [Aspergillus aculeatinus CBS 121060]RAH64069.1 60S ribosomal protein L5 [Aspergillus aculeatinus CBS 121060]
MSDNQRPRGLLFDIGGVCVLSPFQAILDYELAHNIPPGWVNFSISRTAPNGSWHRLERGDIKMDADFFAGFQNDLQNPSLWKQFQEKIRGENPTGTQSPTPPVPKLDAEFLFWEMMRVSRTPDPHMFPALKKLKESGQFILGALSNTVIFPDGHPYNRDLDERKSQFDFFISSAHTGLRKPDQKIYEAALRDMNRIAKEKGQGEVHAVDVVFLDDIGENLKGAKKAGMRTLKVNLGRTQDAVRELEKMTGLHRYQTKYRRRREGKTDYYARKRLITQAKNKYNAPKYRLVVRFTNRDVICQIVYSEISGDKVFAAAYSHELKRYGITNGLTNWAAAYATGLLVGRRALKKLNLDETFTGVEEADGEYTLTEAAETDDGERRPFKVVLDVGLARTSTGARVFGAMKGCSDAGVLVPHSESRFPGFDIEAEELDAETLRNYIFGGHVAEYMEGLADDDEERFRGQFHKYTEAGIEAGDIEDLYTEAHKAIREDPFKKDEDADSKKTKEEWKAESKKFRKVRLTHDERKARVEQKIRELAA